jgi:hypothetical protein
MREGNILQRVCTRLKELQGTIFKARELDPRGIIGVRIVRNKSVFFFLVRLYIDRFRAGDNLRIYEPAESALH